MRLRRVVFAAGVSFLVAAGCGGGDGLDTTPAVLPADGGAGQVVQGVTMGNLVTLPVSIEGTPAMSFIVDTGSPLTLVDPNRFASLGLPSGVGTAAAVDVGGLHLMNVAILSTSPCGVMMCSETTPAGLLGGDVLGNFSVTIDYATGTVGFDVQPETQSLGAPSTSSFDLLGGGHVIVSGGANVNVPATRIAVDVAIEGSVHPFVLDTGSSQVLLSAELFDAIVADGRPQGSASVLTITGTTTQPTTVLSSVALGDAEQKEVGAVRSPFALDSLAREIGHTVDGLLGGSYLTRFVVQLDYRRHVVTLWPR
ncbi:MAG TPA: aspartyl protease family protein [Polyangia bacterium]|jgi:hypothetical protein|nr:aspartyl protease family protein [Polyangia bacterium]